MTNYGFARKKTMTWAGILAIVAGLLVASGGPVHAKSSYLSSFNSTYGTSGTALNSCNICHPGGNTGQFTSYGNAYRTTNRSFASIESLDSDGDGFTNIAEITARTFPGDAASKPATTPSPDTTSPTVTSTSPPAGQNGVPVNAAVTATFSETMAGASLNSATFTVADGSGNPVSGTVTVTGATATFAPSVMLANGMAYTATVTTGARDLAGNGLAQTRTWNFTTIAAASDTDGDGVPDNLDAFPSDNRKATVANPMGGQGMATIDTSANAGTRLMWADGMADTDGSLNQAGKPAGYAFPNGMVSYVVAGVTPGGTATVVISYPEAIPADSRVYKVDSAGFHEFPGAVINGNTVTLTLTDGGAGDADGVANGVIDDPVGLAIPAAGTPVDASAFDSSGGGCSVAGKGGSPVDAVGAYGLLALIALGLLVRKAAPGRR